ncbi:calcium-binding protein [Pseudooceanicola nanhaiensis]|uniref:calcium-binding protein n=1 Tax=Pseudooceanicola nanhaiensis TaxID=375761 RepID=UPI001CD23428|nr:hypothetical protein [Pseudooceanicola nanhaiensis]MCA0920008.1 hypothetical protein [Pseudooceanicola nanhaiensis]
MTSLTYWYPMNDWTPESGAPSSSDVAEAALRYSTMGVTNLVIGIDGRKMSGEWDYLDGFDSDQFRADLEQTLDTLFASGFEGSIEFMPIAGNYNWQTHNLQRSYWMVEATLSFIGASAYGDRVAGIVTDTEFAPTPEWRNADDLGKAEILRQYVTLLEGINDRVKAFDQELTTTTYHGAYIDKGNSHYVLDGVNYGNSSVLGAHVDTIILPIRLTDAIDPGVEHDFDKLIARAVSQTADELAHLEGTATRIVIDFEWEEGNRDLGAPNYYAQIEAAFAEALADAPALAGFAVFISPSLSTVPLSDLRIEGPDTSDLLKGTTGNDTIFGGGGDDTLLGLDGTDVIEGEAGDDSIDGGDWGDWLRGDAGNDILDGGLGADHLRGGEGNDTLLGGGGADDLLGGNGKDRLFGQGGNDTLTGGASRDRLSGGAGDDSLDGGYGNDLLKGGTGDDWLIGGGNDDDLTGGAGEDSFVFVTAQFGDDTIRDFAPGQDQVVLGGAFDEVTDFAGFAAATTQDGDTLVYDLGGDGEAVLRFEGLTLADLAEGDLLFL